MEDHHGSRYHDTDIAVIARSGTITTTVSKLTNNDNNDSNNKNNNTNNDWF